MIDIGKILSRAWHVLWNYKILWIFGILVVLTAGGGAGANARGSYSGSRGYNGSNGYNGGQPENLPAFMERTNEWFDTVAEPWFEETVAPWFATPDSIVRFLIWAVVIVIALSIVFWLLGSLVRYPSETALMRMVDDYEEDDTKVGFKQGWRLGWSRRAFRLWVIDILIHLPGTIFGLTLIVLGLVAAASAIRGNWAVTGGAIFAMVVGVILLGLAVLLVSLFFSLLRPFFARKAALEGTGIGDSFRLGWATVKGNWQSAGLAWLVMIGLGIAYGLASFILFIAMIPVMLITALAGLIVAAIPAALAYWIASLTTIAPIAWIPAVLIGFPFFLLVTFSPFFLIGGWVEVYKSSFWTLTYREIKVLEGAKPAGDIPATA